MDALSYKTVSAKKSEVKKEWLLIDAEGMVLGRLATEVANRIRGKHKPCFTPHVDCGDHVVIINADKIRLTGKKWTDKQVIRHTGYPGGQRILSPREVMAKNPCKLVETAVKGMLPKSRLGNAIFHNLHVYAGTEHKHEAQQPKTVEL
ncbi:MAG: 50S ribosomal protein L13 [Bernardetiaceae bacterium]|nr:50S ribosomal protein L13 [Bernardetiaceae bacterium]